MPRPFQAIDSLTSHSTSTTNTRRVFSWTRVDDGVDKNLQRVLQLKARHCIAHSFPATGKFIEVYSYLSGEQINDFECMLNDADSHKLFAVVASVHHERVGKALYDGALCLAEALHLVSTSRMWQILGILFFDCNVVVESDVADLYVFGRPLSEEFDVGLLRDTLDLIIPVRHDS